MCWTRHLSEGVSTVVPTVQRGGGRWRLGLAVWFGRLERGDEDEVVERPGTTDRATRCRCSAASTTSAGRATAASPASTGRRSSPNSSSPPTTTTRRRRTIPTASVWSALFSLSLSHLSLISLSLISKSPSRKKFAGDVANASVEK